MRSQALLGLIQIEMRKTNFSMHGRELAAGFGLLWILLAIVFPDAPKKEL